MVLNGTELRDVLSQTENAIELRNEPGRCIRTISSQEALALDLDLFVGIGNLRRIRFLRARNQRWSLNNGSRTTKRMTNGFGTVIATPQIREHRAIQQ